MNGKTSISALQELMQARRLQPPYYVEECLGTQFKCTVFAGEVIATGVSLTKKAAKHESAKNALQKLLSLSSLKQPCIQRAMDNYVGKLNEFASKTRCTNPDYHLVPNSGVFESVYLLKCSFQNKQTIGRGVNKKDAKQDAARKMLQLLEGKRCTSEDIDEIIALYGALTCHSQLEVQEKLATVRTLHQSDIEKEGDVEVLKDMLQKLGVHYTLCDLQTEPCIIVSLVIDETDIKFQGKGMTREEAVKKVLQKVLIAKSNGGSFNTDGPILIKL